MSKLLIAWSVKRGVIGKLRCAMNVCRAWTQGVRFIVTLCFRICPEEVSKTIRYLLTYSMEQSPSWEANQFSASQEIPRILWNPKVRCRIHKCPPLVPILSQIDPVHAFTSHFLKSHLYIIFPSKPGSSRWSLSIRFPHQNRLYISPPANTCHLPRPPHSSRFDNPINIGWRVQIIKPLIM